MKIKFKGFIALVCVGLLSNALSVNAAGVMDVVPKEIESKGRIQFTSKGKRAPDVIFSTADLQNLKGDFITCQEMAEATRVPMVDALKLKGVMLSENASYEDIANGILSIPNEYIWGVNDPDGITYDYHKHVDNSGTITNDSLNNAVMLVKGGCYQNHLYHTHSGNTTISGGCYANPVYHAHSGSTAMNGGCYTNPVYHAHSGTTAVHGGCYTLPIYHSHSGNSTTNGGCYTTPIYHIHSGSTAASGDCYTTPVYHTHSSACQSSSRCNCTNYEQGKYLGDHEIDGWPIYECNNCRHGNWEHVSDKCNHETVIRCSKTEGVTIDSWNLGCGMDTSTIVSYALGCGKDASTLESYALGCGKDTSTIDSYSLSCGKTPGTIESYSLSCGKTTDSIMGYLLNCNRVENQIIGAHITF